MCFQYNSGLASRNRWLALACLLLSALPVRAQDLTVFAAASLKEGLDAVATQFQRTSNQKVVISYAASSALAKQVESGAPADVFISADLDWMDYLDQRKLVKAADSKVQVDIKLSFPLAKLLGDGKLSMADPDSVPAGKYGKAALEKLGVWSSVESKVARGDNVRTALNFVARGETPLGIVYQTDAFAEKKVRIVALFPPDTHPAIIYPVAVLSGGKHASAPVFVNYLKSAEARARFERYGFSSDQ